MFHPINKGVSNMMSNLNLASFVQSPNHERAIQIRPKILLVDDQEFLLKIMTQIIEKIRQNFMQNFDIITANNGLEAFEKYTEHQKEIKIILMDINMPIMDGYESA